MSDMNISVQKAEGGQLWFPKIRTTAHARHAHKNTPEEDAHLEQITMVSVIMFILAMLVFIVMSTLNYDTQAGNTVTITSTKLSQSMALVLFFTTCMPLIAVWFITSHAYYNNVPLRSIWKTIREGKNGNFKNFNFITPVCVALITLIISIVFSLQIPPPVTQYDYKDPKTGETVSLKAYPNNETDYAEYINPVTNKIKTIKVEISDLKVKPFETSYVITHTGELEPPIRDSETNPNPYLVEQETVQSKTGKEVTLHTDGTYTLE